MMQIKKTTDYTITHTQGRGAWMPNSLNHSSGFSVCNLSLFPSLWTLPLIPGYAPNIPTYSWPDLSLNQAVEYYAPYSLSHPLSTLYHLSWCYGSDLKHHWKIHMVKAWTSGKSCLEVVEPRERSSRLHRDALEEASEASSTRSLLLNHAMNYFPPSYTPIIV